MTAVAASPDVREDVRDFSRAWWLFLVSGLIWIFFGLFILDFDLQSVTAIAYITGAVILIASIEEFVMAFTASGWKWMHAILGLLFLGGGIYAFAYPGRTFGTLAMLIAWFLLIKGTFDICVSLANTGAHLWWLGLIAGIIQILIAFWALGYPGRSAYLLVVWVGLSALFRGIGHIFLAFQVKKLKEVV